MRASGTAEDEWTPDDSVEQTQKAPVVGLNKLGLHTERAATGRSAITTANLSSSFREERTTQNALRAVEKKKQLPTPAP